MQLRHRQLFTAIRTEGAILPADLLQRIDNLDHGLGGLSPEDYHLPPGVKLNEAINQSWNRMKGAWSTFQTARARLVPNDTATTVTREKWLLPLFQELNYGRLKQTPAVEIEGRSYAVFNISNNVPIHLVGAGVDLDQRTAGVAGAAKMSPHGMVQELLNREDNYLWGFVSNGLQLRILRDNVSLTRQAFVEFDLEMMMMGELYSDFTMLWLLCHESRVSADKASEFWLEKWSKKALDDGTRALEQLRNGVEEAIKSFGQGFLAHPANKSLLENLKSGTLDKQDYYRQLLRMVYRLIFLFVAEDRELLFPPETGAQARERYTRFYSLSRLRRLAGKRVGTRHHDLYQGLRLVMAKLSGEENAAGYPELALPALGSFLFEKKAVEDLHDCEIENAHLLAAIRALAYLTDQHGLRTVDYKNLRSEELGSVYEALLELHPEINAEARHFDLPPPVAGNERKKTGSYYTPESLVQCLLDSALDPVVDEAIKQSDPDKAILNLKICDPACGSGHFLIAAAHRLAKRLASIRTGDDEPSPAATRTALRDVIGHCIYGVDINPMAVELCKVSLWMEALEPGKPLSFLEHRIQCGNSLIGATPALLKKGIPDDVFKAIEGDDKATCSEYRRYNKQFRESGQRNIFESEIKLGVLAETVLNLEAIDDSTIGGVREKQRRWEELVRSNDYLYGGLFADAWCAAFVWKKLDDRNHPRPITEEMFRKIEQSPWHIARTQHEIEIKRLAAEYQFFHWHLAFPDAFRAPVNDEKPENEQAGWSGGFDVILSNPPWEKINLRDEEFFAQTHPEIANAANKDERKRLIKQLKANDPSAYELYEVEKGMHDRTSAYFRSSGCFPLTGVSRINLYSVFCETVLFLLAPVGRCGLVLASGIVTDDNNKALFSEIIHRQRLICTWDFENREGIFSSVHKSYKFCLFCAGGKEIHQHDADFAFYLTNIEQLAEPYRHFTLNSEDLGLLNPNTRTCPTFRTKRDAEITKTIYYKVPAWALHLKRENWPGSPKTPFNMSNDSGLFEGKVILLQEGWKPNGRGGFQREQDLSLPLYESKLMHQFNHRYATFAGQSDDDVKNGNATEIDPKNLADTSLTVECRYWLNASIQAERFPGKWFLAFRDITNATNERTTIAAILPSYPCGHSLTIIQEISAFNALLLCANLNAFTYDYIARQKTPGVHLNQWILKQLPVLSIEQIQNARSFRLSEGSRLWLVKRAMELTYTAYDLQGFAEDCSYTGEPFRWDEERRFLLRCELDAAYFHLYGINRDDVDYILDTFPIVKRKDEQAHGEYRTKRVILEIYDEMKRTMETGATYQTRLGPPPANGWTPPELPREEAEEKPAAQAAMAVAEQELELFPWRVEDSQQGFKFDDID